MECKICKVRNEMIRGWVFTNTKDIPVSYDKYKLTGGSVYCKDCFENIKETKERKFNQNVLVRKYFDKYKFESDFRVYAYNQITLSLKVLNKIKKELEINSITLNTFDKLFTKMLPLVMKNNKHLVSIGDNTIDFMTKDLNINNNEISSADDIDLLEYIRLNYNDNLDLEIFYSELVKLFGGRILYIYTFGLEECYIKTDYGAKGVIKPRAYISKNNNVFMMDCEIYSEPLINFINVTRKLNTNVIFRCK